MKIPKISLVQGTAFLGLVILNGCSSNDAYTDGGYENGYDPSQSGYYPPAGDSSPGGYGYGYPGDPGNSSGGYGDPNYGNYSEAGEVVSVPGDTFGGGNQASAPSPGWGSSGSNTNSSSSARTYTVVKGDNLYKIGRRFGSTMTSIKDANGLTSTVIHPGQQLIIP